MTYADTLKYSIAVFPTLYKSRAAVLNQLFCVYPKIAAQVRILDRIEEQKKTDKYANISGKIPYNADDPLEVEVAKEMIAARKQMSEDILAMLDKTKTAGAGDEDE
jgi:hypothetical protein